MAAHPTPESDVTSSGTVPARRRLRWVVVSLGGLMLLAIAVSAWLVRPGESGAITKRSELQKLPEDQLFFPGATLLQSTGRDFESGVWGSNPATSGHTLGVHADKGEVLAFYERELAVRGWQKTSGVGVGTSELEVLGWWKDRVTIRIAILRKNDPRNPAAINAYQTAYEIALFAERP